MNNHSNNKHHNHHVNQTNNMNNINNVNNYISHNHVNNGQIMQNNQKIQQLSNQEISIGRNHHNNNQNLRSKTNNQKQNSNKHNYSYNVNQIQNNRNYALNANITNFIIDYKRKSLVIPSKDGNKRKRTFKGKYELTAYVPVKYKTVDYYMLIENIRINNENALKGIKRNKASDILNLVLDSLEFLSYVHK